MLNRPQLFRINKTLIEALTREEVEATWSAMVEAGVANPPFDTFHVEAPFLDLVKVYDPKDYHYLEKEEFTAYEQSETMKFVYTPNASWTLFRGVKLHDALERVMHHKEECAIVQAGCIEQREVIYRMLIVLLATKNIVKTTTRNKLASMGIGLKKNPYEFVTTLTIGKVTESTEEGEPTGRTVRPHLRRGHVRQQHYGPATEEHKTGSFVKAVFIQPVFVNADENWINSRKAYNVSIGG